MPLNVSIPHLSHSKVLLGAALALVMGLRSDAIKVPPTVRIAYIGSWTESKDLVFERFTEALRSRYPELLRRATIRHIHAEAGNNAALERAVRHALSENPAVLVTPTGRSSRIATRLAGAVPVVFSTSTDPVRTSIRESLQYAKGASTGVSLADWLDEKRLEILRDAFPQVREVAILSDRSWATLYDAEVRLARVSHSLGLRATLVFAENPTELAALMSSARAQRFDAWYIPPTYIAYLAEDQIIEHLRRMQKPSMHATTQEVSKGALMAYEQDSDFAISAMAELVNRVCAGEFAGAIPVQTPQRYTLALRTDVILPSLRIAPDVVRRADRIY